ncbi:alpha/beta fold hydrolase [Streptomyces sp. NPDC056069]|uniref:alpha/beta fold hydrolase n=1 Tax=Streptomyces sp. NPDC056069 TaxID=3345702 RepID=UPI0035DC0F34
MAEPAPLPAPRPATFARAQDGTALAYQHRGEGPPLVLLAGQANDHHWWDDVREDFHATHSTLTLDARGTGDSDKPRGPYSTRQFADDVIAVLDALGIERADVYGTSMGGRVAQWIAIAHPRRVRRLVLGCTSPGGPRAVERDATVRRALARPDADAVRLTLADLMYSPAWRAAHPGPYRTLGDPRMPAHARHAHLLASNGHDAWDALPRIAAPTLVLHGDQDRLTPPDNLPLLASRIPGALTHLFPGARHAYFEECRAEAGTLVRTFLGSGPAEESA